MILDKKISLNKDTDKQEEITDKKEESILEKLLQEQICHEFNNEKLYLIMSIWCENKGYVNTAKFFNFRSLEERAHGMDFINYLSKQKIQINPPCDLPINNKFDDLKSLLIAALKQEKLTTDKIKEIHKEALKTSDLALTIAGKYLREQLEEEQLFASLINLYNLCDGSKFDFETMVLSIKDKYKIGTL